MSETVDLSAILGRIPLFRELDDGQRERVARGCRFLKAARGETVVHRGEPPDGFYYLIQGRVKLVLTSPLGAEKVVEIVRDGETFGEAVMFIDRPYPVSAQATEACHLVYLSREAILEDLEREPGLARRMLAGLSARLHGIIRDVEVYSLYSAVQRVIGYLIYEAEERRASGGACTLELPVAKAVIASRLNLTPETLSRVFHELSEKGLIRVHGREVELVDIERLRGYGQ
ncbi:Crp/Fnr family transcriptional regulator [Endothiovibrio diazotrophicus]